MTTTANQARKTDRERAATETFDVAGMTVPNLFIIGAPKCGTTSLFHYLESHPDIYLSDPKEPNWWATDFPGAVNHKFVDIRTFDDYMCLFAPGSDHAVVGEGSTCYLFSSQAIPNLVRQFPHAKFIACVRNPLKLIPSFHDHQLRCFEEDQHNLVKAWELQSSRREGQQVPVTCQTPEFLQYAEFGRLGSQIERMFAHVPAAQRLVIVLDDLSQNPVAEYQRVLNFLGLSYDGRTEFPAANEAHQYRFRWLAQLVRRPPAWLSSPMRWVMKTMCSRDGKSSWMGFAKRMLKRGNTKSPIAESIRHEMTETFRDDVALLGRLLERDLSHWLEEESR